MWSLNDMDAVERKLKERTEQCGNNLTKERKAEKQ